MSQTYDSTKPESGVTKLSQLYQIIRDHIAALVSNFSHATDLPLTPVEGQHGYVTGTKIEKIYTSAGWKEVINEGAGIGLEIIGARGSAGALDTRLDMALNEDGTLKASTTLSPSEWTTIATGYTFTYVNSTTFDVSGDQTAVYYPSRRIKALLTGSNVYSSVVSATYTTQTRVVINDAVLDATLPASQGIEHSIIRPSKNDGAISQEMIRFDVTTCTGDYNTTINDSVIYANTGSGNITVNLMLAVGAGTGKVMFIKKISASNTLTVSGSTFDKTSLILSDLDDFLIVMTDSSYWRTVAFKNNPGWTNVSSFGTGWTGTGVSYMKDPMGFVHFKGYITLDASAAAVGFTLPTGYKPVQQLYIGAIIDGDFGTAGQIYTNGEVRIASSPTINGAVLLDIVAPFKAA